MHDSSENDQQLRDCKKKLSLEIKKNEELFHKLCNLEKVISLLPGHIYLKDKSGKFLACNDLQARDFGGHLGICSSKDLLGKTDYDLFSEEVASKIYEIDRKVIDSKISYTAEESVILPNNKEAIYLSHKLPFFEDENSEPVGVMGVSLDITDRKKNGKRFKKSQRRS